jgi:putative nucleotidyltransferase with HDIG domain
MPDLIAGSALVKWFKQLKERDLPHLDTIPRIVCLCSFVLAAFVVVTNMQVGDERLGDLHTFEVGKVADKDIIAEYPLSYIDQNATRLRMEAQEQLVPAVFRYSDDISKSILSSWNSFCDFAAELADSNSSQASKRLAVQAEYPAYFNAATIDAYFADPVREQFRDYGLLALDEVLKRGIFALDDIDIRGHNPDMVELLIPSRDRIERERVSLNGIVTKDNIWDAITRAVENTDFSPEPENGLSSGFQLIVPALLIPFIHENTFYSSEDTQMRVAEAMNRVSPVVKNIEKGKRIIRKGFIITEEEILDLQALSAALPQKDPRSAIGLVLSLALLYVLFILLQDKFILGKALSVSESSLLFVMVCLYLAGAGLTKNLVPALSSLPVSLFFPTALMVMILAVFMGPLRALIMAMALPLSACFAGFYDIQSYFFALISGVAASIVLKHAEKRMDLIKAGLAIAAVNCFAIIVILLMRTADIGDYPLMLFWAALNGIVSGMLILGVLSPLEHVLNAATTFRLIELSDLNAPILRKLFTTAPGTYSHSIMVANLAEQACQDIGANALLARVGAYYHDIGKMDNPNYFVENQTDYNRHDNINPRLSATVIRSHVKLGVEKARSLGLPTDVISIVAEHHGNSLIVWFYKKATEQEEQVHSEDFSYPGIPPRSKESAVVMLADVTEAAVRTLTKPTVAKMEKFIQQLIDDKVRYGQLAQSDLTFHELEIIKKAFVRMLAGYYHSRIEYPKIGGEKNGDKNGDDKTAADMAADKDAEPAPLPETKEPVE